MGDAGKTKHPEAGPGSIDAYWFTASVTAASAAVQGRKCGSVPPLHAAPAVSNHRIPACHRRAVLSIRLPHPRTLCDFTGAPQHTVEADRPGQLVHANHRQEQSEEHTSELQSPVHLVCRLLLEKKKQYKR